MNERTNDRMNEKSKHIRTFGNEPYVLAYTQTQAHRGHVNAYNCIHSATVDTLTEEKKKKKKQWKSIATIRAMTWTLCKHTATQQQWQQPRAERSGKHWTFRDEQNTISVMMYLFIHVFGYTPIFKCGWSPVKRIREWTQLNGLRCRTYISLCSYLSVS